MKIKLLAAVAATVVASSVMAQSAFEGAYGQLGVGYENVSPTFSSGTVAGRSYNVSANNSNSFVGTATIGYSFAVAPSFLLGIGAEYSPFSGNKANFTLNVPSAAYSATAQYNKQNSYNIFVTPGIVIAKDKLAYAKVGYTGVNIQSTAGDTSSLTGYSLGIGYKQIISGGLYGFGEVNYASYGNVNVGGGASGTVSANSTNALVGLGYKF